MCDILFKTKRIVFFLERLFKCSFKTRYTTEQYKS